MKKILSIIIVLVLILYMVYKIDTVNRTKAKIIDITTTLMDSISSQDYEKIKIYLKHADGTELTDEEISNFLLNTGLYRATLVEDETFLYDTNISFWNIHKGKILFSFIALNGENISNTLEYVRDGIHEYLVADKIQESTKETEKYPIALDLADGSNVEYGDESLADEDTEKIKIYSFVQDENGGVSVEFIKEAKEDLEKHLEIQMYEEIDNLKKLNENYTMEWDNEYKEVSIYYEDSVKDKMRIKEWRLFLYSLLKQGINGNSDWKLTIQYYDYNTRELLSTKVIR